MVPSLLMNSNTTTNTTQDYLSEALKHLNSLDVSVSGECDINTTNTTSSSGIASGSGVSSSSIAGINNINTEGVHQDESELSMIDDDMLCQ